MNPNYLFYFRRIDSHIVVGVVNIEPDEHRHGWLRGYVVHCRAGDKVYLGADYSISADHVFNSGLYDYGKDLSKVGQLTAIAAKK